MNSRLTMSLAGLLMVGAVFAGYKGLTVGRDTPPAPLNEPLAPMPRVDEQQANLSLEVAKDRLESVRKDLEDEQRTAVVVLKRDLPALTQISAEDLDIELLKLAPPETFSDTNLLIGMRTWKDLPAGLILTEQHLQNGGPIAQMIRPEERALAISIDEVTSAGGHLRPGDFVDLLLYLRRDDINTDQTAQLVLPAIRVLSVGDQLGATLSGDPALYTLEDDTDTRRRNLPAKTAVIAVHEKLMTRLWLATQIQGSSIRLAVRSLDEELLAKYYAGETIPERLEEAERQLFQFEQLALRQATPTSRAVSSRPVSPQANPSKPKVEIYRGAQASSHAP